MLILEREEEQTIWIGEDIFIKVCKTRQNKVSLGIHAPREKTILRGELRTTKEQSEAVAELEATQ